MFADEFHKGFGDSDALVVGYGHDAADSVVTGFSYSVCDGDEPYGLTLIDGGVAVAGWRYVVAQIVILLKVIPETSAAGPDIDLDRGVPPFFLSKLMSSVQRTQLGSR